VLKFIHLFRQQRTTPMLLTRWFGKRIIRTCRATFRPSLEALDQRIALSSLPIFFVQPGQSIQAAVDEAPAKGAVIEIEPGTYSEAIVVAKRNIQLVGLGGGSGPGVVLQNPGGQATGITVTSAAKNFVLQNITVQNFDGNGVSLQADGFVLSHVTATNDGDYGLFPEFSANGLIEFCTASGNDDTGIYIGQSQDVVITQNTAFGNVIGIEVENSSQVQVLNNEAYDNVAGILVDLLPGLSVRNANDSLIAGNYVHDNNHANFAPSDDLAFFVPSGIGIFVLGADQTSVVGNLVTGNQFVGVGVASTTFLTSLAGISVAGIEPNPDGTMIHDNVVSGNGSSSPFTTIPGADLLWDGAGMHNCWSDNTYGTSFWPRSPLPLPSC
jgi:parallel beta-helix repeat protein